GPAFRRQNVQQFPRSRQQDYTIEVRDFPAFDFAIFVVNINIDAGQKLADGGSTRPPVRHANHGLWIEVTFNRPAMPHPRHCGSRVDQHTVQVKQQGTAADCDHLFYFTLPAEIDQRGSPVDSKLTPPTAVPDASRLRIFSRFGPARWMASARLPSACSIGVPSGRRKIQGILVVVRARSEEMATTGINDFTAICSAKRLEVRSSAIKARA